jgi:hypothetical protein
MATRKKKESVKLTIPNAIGAAKIEVGTHLTVYTYEDGSTKLVWDDEQLLKEVREAIASVKTVKPAVKAKSVKKVPEAMKRKEPVKELPPKTTTKTPAKNTVAKKKTK